MIDALLRILQPIQLLFPSCTQKRLTGRSHFRLSFLSGAFFD